MVTCARAFAGQERLRAFPTQEPDGRAGALPFRGGASAGPRRLALDRTISCGERRASNHLPVARLQRPRAFAANLRHHGALARAVPPTPRQNLGVGCVRYHPRCLLSRVEPPSRRTHGRWQTVPSSRPTKFGRRAPAARLLREYGAGLGGECIEPAPNQDDCVPGAPNLRPVPNPSHPPPSCLDAPPLVASPAYIRHLLGLRPAAGVARGRAPPKLLIGRRTDWGGHSRLSDESMPCSSDELFSSRASARARSRRPARRRLAPARPGCSLMGAPGPTRFEARGSRPLRPTRGEVGRLRLFVWPRCRASGRITPAPTFLRSRFRTVRLVSCARLHTRAACSCPRRPGQTRTRTSVPSRLPARPSPPRTRHADRATPRDLARALLRPPR